MGAFLYILCGVYLTTANAFSSGHQLQQLLSKAVGDFHGTIIPNLYRQRTNGTAIHCQRLCLWDKECMSFFHNSITDMCQTHGVVYFNPGDGQLSLGSKYFRQVQERCPSELGYIYNRALDFCYKFHYDNPSTPAEARQVCHDEGGKLVITNTTEKFDHIGWTIRGSTFPATSYPGIMIGATDEDNAGDWRWPNDQQVDSTILRWCPGEPLDLTHHHTVMVESDNPPPVCVNAFWGTPKHFVCERQIHIFIQV